MLVDLDYMRNELEKRKTIRKLVLIDLEKRLYEAFRNDKSHIKELSKND